MSRVLREGFIAVMNDFAGFRVRDRLPVPIASAIDLPTELHPATRLPVEIVAFDELESRALPPRLQDLATGLLVESEALADVDRIPPLRGAAPRASPVVGGRLPGGGGFATELACGLDLALAHEPTIQRRPTPYRLHQSNPTRAWVCSPRCQVDGPRPCRRPWNRPRSGAPRRDAGLFGRGTVQPNPPGSSGSRWRAPPVQARSRAARPLLSAGVLQWPPRWRGRRAGPARARSALRCRGRGCARGRGRRGGRRPRPGRRG